MKWIYDKDLDMNYYDNDTGRVLLLGLRIGALV